ncbi:hypothetical protein O1L60_31315 [Streptomyces diastatochromogenes]|nr:hypothetical protein [Streptomyces diastatochromogenes]
MAAPKRKAPRAIKRRAPIPTNLSDFLAEKRGASEENFLGTVRTHIVEKNKADDSRRQDIIHPSEMAKSDWCPKATFLRISTGIHHKQSFGFQSLNIFDTGHESHRKWQLRAWDIGWLEGMFKCLNCFATWWAKSPEQCPACESKALEYAEVPLSAEATHLIAGHSDGMLTPARSLLEIKTVGEGTVRYEEPERLSKYKVKLPDGRDMVDLPAMWSSIKVPFPATSARARSTSGWRTTGASMSTGWPSSTSRNSTRTSSSSSSATTPPSSIRSSKRHSTSRSGSQPRARPDCVNGDICKQCKPYQESSDGEDTPRRGRRQALDEDNAEAQPARTEAAKPSRGRYAGPAGEPHGAERRQADGAVRPADEVGRVRRNTASGSRGRREGR